MSGESQNEMIGLLGGAVRAQVINEVKDAEMFAISSDTTPDLSNHDQMAVIVRYVKEMKPYERLLLCKILG